MDERLSEGGWMKRLIAGFSLQGVRMCRVVQHGVPCCVEGGHRFRCRDSSRSTVCEDELVVFLKPCWGSPSQQKLLSSRSPVAAPAVRSRTDVSAFALVVY